MVVALLTLLASVHADITSHAIRCLAGTASILSRAFRQPTQAVRRVAMRFQVEASFALVTLSERTGHALRHDFDTGAGRNIQLVSALAGITLRKICTTGQAV